MKGWFLILFIGFMGVSQSNFAQNPTKKIAIFTPFYLDSAYKNNSYAFDQQFPKFLNPGIEFWQGAMIAIDSLKANGANLEIQVFDIKSKNKKLLDVLLDSNTSKLDLIIGHVNVNEAALIAQFAKLREIPFININLPNSVNQTENPYYYILNATLPTHFTAIFRKIQSHYSIENHVLFKRKNEQDDYVASMFDRLNTLSATIPLKLKVVELLEDFNLDDISPHINSDKHNVVISASLDVQFAKKLAKAINEVQEEYNSSITIFGMPTWDQINFKEPEYSGLEIFFTTSFNYDPANETIAHLTDWYKSKYFARPSDMVFRGYEIILKFCTLLQNYEGKLALHPELNQSNIFTQFHMLPIYNYETNKIEYWENKQIYFVRLASGEVVEIK